MDAVIVAACRTAVGDSFKTPLAMVPAQRLAGIVITEVMQRAGVTGDEVDDLVFGEVMHGGGVIGRYAAHELGLVNVPGMAVNRHCATSLSAISVAAAQIAAGMSEVAIAGGVENISQTPVTRMRTMDGEVDWVSLTHPDNDDAPPMNMGITVGENTARIAGVSREEQDAWALRSHRRAIAAIDEGRFTDEIVPIDIEVGDDTVTFDVDTRPRRDTTAGKLAALPPAFREDGTVTAGNSSGLNDGAAAVVVTSARWAEERGLEPLATIRSWASVGVDPVRTGLAPTLAVPKALEKAGIPIDEVDLVELNEAFASMAVACTRELGLDEDIVNVNGGGVALGHPVAATGAKLTTTLVHELGRRGGGTGVVTMCAGGGMGAAMVLDVH
ncbi:MAG: thiolase family protein [Nitriliruptorales bacterium]|nr:thiolase family protein [Nitriliruptorales bacterium]